MIADPFDDAPPSLDIINGDTIPDTNPRSKGQNSPGDQGTNVPVGWKPTIAEPIPVVRCTATIRNGDKKGERCGKWSMRGATVCLSHGGHLPSVKEHAQSVVEAARMRMIGLADDAIDAIEDLVTNPGTQQNVRLKAATEILDRIGVKGAPDLAITVEHTVSAADVISEKLKGMALRLAPKPEPEDLGETEEHEVLDEEGPVL